MKGFSLKAQIQMLVFAAVLVATAAMVMIATVQIREQSQLARRARAECMVADLARDLGPAMQAEDHERVVAPVDAAITAGHAVSAEIHDSEGNILYAQTAGPTASNLGYRCEKQGVVPATTTIDSIDVSQPVWVNGHQIGRIDVTVPVERSHVVSQGRIEIVLGAAALLLVVISVLGIWAAGRVVAPIDRFRSAVKRITHGNWDSPLRADQFSGEFAPLAEAFGEMQQQLRQAFDALHQSRESLEKEIVLRTSELKKELSERHQAEVALKENEQLYRTLFETANDAIFIMHKDRFIDCNARTLVKFDCTTEQIIGQPPYRFSPKYQPDGRLSKEKALEKINGVLHGEHQFFEWRHCRYDETPFEAEVSLTHLESMGQDFIIAIVRDITARKQSDQHRAALQDRLERAQRMESLGVLAGGVAHDLNNMLGPLVGYPELILSRLPAESLVRGQIKKMGDAAQQAASVIQDLLTLARRGRCDMAPLSLNKVIDDYLDSPSLTRLLENRPDIQIEKRLADELSSLHGSAPHLTKVLMNLIVNALDAMPTGGTLTIQTSQKYLERLDSGFKQVTPQEYVVLSVKDTGVGIPAEMLAKIFEPYFSRKVMGTSGSGLGLAVVYGTVKDHHGYYDVFSTVGKGTEFVLYFPTTDDSVPTSQVSIEDLRGTESILVVDDVAEQREVASELLASLGYRVQVVADGREAVAYLKNGTVDLVVLDMIMEEGFDGLDTYREILRIHPSQRALIVSGFSATDRVQEMLAMGAGGYVKKPYTIDVLGTAVKRELKRLPARQLQQA